MRKKKLIRELKDRRRGGIEELDDKTLQGVTGTGDPFISAARLRPRDLTGREKERGRV